MHARTHTHTRNNLGICCAMLLTFVCYLLSIRHGMCVCLSDELCVFVSVFLDPGLRKEMGDQAVALAKAVNYDSAGENSLQRSVELWLKPSAGILQVRARCRVWQSSGLRCQLWFCRWELGVEIGRTLAKAVSYDSAGVELWLKPSAMILQVRIGCRALAAAVSYDFAIENSNSKTLFYKNCKVQSKTCLITSLC